MMTDSNIALLVDLSCRQWARRRVDKGLTRDVALTHGVSPAVVSASKRLADAPELLACSRIITAAHAYHYGITLPWSDSGLRLLPVRQWADYQKKLADYQQRLADAVRALQQVWPCIVDRARQELGGLFSPNDYPAVDQLPELYGISFGIYDLTPDEHDLRVRLGADAALAALKTQQERIQQGLSNARAELVRRASGLLQTLKEVCSQPASSTRLHESLLTKLGELAGVLPEFAPEVADVAADMAAMAEAGAGPLRTSPEDRAAAADTAAVLLERLTSIG